MVRIIKNQIVAKPGPLPFFEDGKVVYKEKTWENLKQFINIKVPITDGHPAVGVVGSDTKLYGSATYHQCPKMKEVLCADLEMNDDAPQRDGYSIGYIYTEEAPSKGSPAQVKQNITKQNHLALANMPREPYATRLLSDAVMGSDSVESNKNNTVNKSFVGYDSFIKFDFLGNSGNSQKNGDFMTEEEYKKLLEENANLKAKIAGDSTLHNQIEIKEKEIVSLKESNAKLTSDLKIAGDTISELNKVFEEQQKGKMNDAIKELTTKHGYDSKELEGKSWEAIEATLAANIRKSKSGVTIGGDAKLPNSKSIVSNTNDFRWNGKDWVLK